MTAGISCMAKNVSRKPSNVWIVSIVPTKPASTSSVMAAENCAESATMVMPQTIATAMSAIAPTDGNRPIDSAQRPLIAIDAIVIGIRP